MRDGYEGHEDERNHGVCYVVRDIDIDVGTVQYTAINMVEW